MFPLNQYKYHRGVKVKLINKEELQELQNLLKRKNFEIERYDIISLLKKNRAVLGKFFKNMAFTRIDTGFSDESIRGLVNNGIIDYNSEVEMSLTLTLKGYLVIKYELIEVQTSVDKLLDEMNAGYFLEAIGESKTSLEFYEKSAILTLLGLLALSKKYPLKISTVREKQEEETFVECAEKAANFILSLPGYNYTKEKIWKSNAEGNRAVGFLRRLDTIKARTESIYDKSGSGEHYLDILENGSLDDKKVSYLMRRVFDKRSLTSNERAALVLLLKDIEGHRITLLGNNPDFIVSEILSDLSYKVRGYKSMI